MPVGKIYNLVRPVGKFQASQRIAFAKECSSASAEHEKLNQEPLSQVIATINRSNVTQFKQNNRTVT